MPPYCYKPLSLNERSIRLVRITPASHVEDAIVLLIDHSVLDSENLPSYETISYVWGSEDIQKTVYIDHENGATLSIAQNLNEALRYIRDGRVERVMWIDAICIDQENLKERGKQVAFMHEIYQHGTSMVLWMGSEADDSHQAMHDLDWLGSKIRLNPDRSLSAAAGSSDELCELSDPSKQLPLDPSQVTNIYHFLCRPWFDRVWIRQEIYMSAPKVVVKCGEAEISWKHCRIALIALFDKTISGKLRDRLDKLDGIIEQIRIDRQPIGTVKLCYLRFFLGNSQCKDPRDRVYGVRELLQETRKGLEIIPDYTVPTHTAYKRVVSQYLRLFGNIDVLTQCELHDESPKPTWVPDWSLKSQWGALWQPALASSQLASIIQFPDGDVIRVAGVPVATVDSTVPTGLTSGMAFNDIKERIQAHVSKDINDGYPDRTRLEEIYSTTILTGRVAETYYPPSALLLPEKRNQELLEYLTYNDNISDFNGTRLFAGKSAGVGEGRVFFKATGGVIGIAPMTIQPGDQVCVLLGCAYLMVLRPTADGQFLMVSSCYMHGANYGEAVLGELPEGIRVVRHWERRLGWHWAFSNKSTGVTDLLDPRLGCILTDSSKFRLQLQEDKTAKIRIDLAVLQQYNKKIRLFDLV
ncbi:HET-domain-containing protein [Apiospora phragmitis]|uniref:HET-domain-containing protein n=1 Tax=Apiospora phragmitis TaxID=2905665 RepID=A0ABR1X723_9PEZI